MTREEKQKAIDALKISAPIMIMTEEKFNDYIQTLNKTMDWLEQEPTTKNDLGVDAIPRKQIDEMIAEIIDKSWNIDMYDSDLDFECSYLSDVLSIIHKYCDKEQTDEL